MGLPGEKYDSMGREKIECRFCQKWYHRLDVHLATAHKCTVKEYANTFPGAPTISAAASLKASAGQAGRAAAKPAMDVAPAKAAAVVVADESGLCRFGHASLYVRTDLTDVERQLVPSHDPNWILEGKEQELLEELALGVESSDNILIVGPPGVGKTTLAMELAATLGQPLRRVSMDGDMRRADFVGSKEVTVDKESGQAVTSWADGILPQAAEAGHWLLCDEIDAMPNHIGFIFHGVLERNRSLSLTGDNGRNVKFNRHFRVIATANTLGQGDDSGRYAGTNVMNEALLDRFGVVIRMEYPSAPAESAMLQRVTGIDHATAGKMVAIARMIREAQATDQVVAGISPRRLLDWAAKAKKMGDVRRAARITVVNKLRADDAKFVANLVQRYFGGEVE